MNQMNPRIHPRITFKANTKKENTLKPTKKSKKGMVAINKKEIDWPVEIVCSFSNL